MKTKFKISTGFLIFVLFSWNVSAANITCDSCSDCSTKLSGSYEVVYLNTSLYDQPGTCVKFFASGITFDCQGYLIDGIGEDHGIYIWGDQNNIIRNCNISQFYSGIRLYNSPNNTILNNTNYDNELNGIDLGGSPYSNIINNINYNNWHAGISIESSPNSTVLNNTNYNNMWGIISHSSNTIITNNTCYDNVAGVNLGSSSNNFVTGNNASNNSWIGIWLSASDTILTENTVNSNGKDGIYLAYSTTNTLINNTANSNGYDGVYVYHSTTNTLINNTANSNVYSGINVYVSSNNIITNNTAKFNKKNGLSFSFSDSTSNTVHGNRFCFNNQSSGDYYDIYDADSNSGDNNTCDTTYNWNDAGTTGCTSNCFEICTCNSCSDCTDKSNNPVCKVVKLTTNISNHPGDCINSTANFTNKVFDCQGHTIDGNYVLNSKGIYINGKSNNTIKNCVIRDFDYGIYLNSSSNNTLQGNEISNNKIGIYSQNSNSTINSNIFCDNVELDFNSSGWLSSSGDNNVCDNPDGWNDTEKIRCSITCKQHLCDLNLDGIYIHDWNDLMIVYNCFLGIRKSCDKLKYQDRNLIEREYQCFIKDDI